MPEPEDTCRPTLFPGGPDLDHPAIELDMYASAWNQAGAPQYVLNAIGEAAKAIRRWRSDGRNDSGAGDVPAALRRRAAAIQANAEVTEARTLPSRGELQAAAIGYYVAAEFRNLALEIENPEDHSQKGRRAKPPPYEPDRELIGYMERGQEAMTTAERESR